MLGSTFCRVHQSQFRDGASPYLCRRPPGRPPKTGRYARHLSPVGQQAFRDAVGDLTTIDEAAIAKALFDEVLQRRRETHESEEQLLASAQQAVVQLEDGSFAPAHSEEERLLARIRRNRKATEEDLHLIETLEKLVKIMKDSADTLSGRRVLLQFGDAAIEEEVRAAVGAFTRELGERIAPLLCPTCKRQVGEALLSAIRTEVVAE